MKRFPVVCLVCGIVLMLTAVEGVAQQTLDKPTPDLRANDAWTVWRQSLNLPSYIPDKPFGDFDLTTVYGHQASFATRDHQQQINEASPRIPQFQQAFFCRFEDQLSFILGWRLDVGTEVKD